jgi:hypothetical protein
MWYTDTFCQLVTKACLNFQPVHEYWSMLETESGNVLMITMVRVFSSRQCDDVDMLMQMFNTSIKCFLFPVFKDRKCKKRLKIVSKCCFTCIGSAVLMSSWKHRFFLVLQLCCLVLFVQKSYLCNRPWRPIGLWDVEDPTLSRQSAHRWGGFQPYTPTRTPSGPTCGIARVRAYYKGGRVLWLWTWKKHSSNVLRYSTVQSSMGNGGRP